MDIYGLKYIYIYKPVRLVAGCMLNLMLSKYIISKSGNFFFLLSLRGNTGYKIEYNCRAKMYQILFYESIIYEENGLDHSPVRIKLKKNTTHGLVIM